MAIIQNLEKSYSPTDIKAIYEWIRRRLGRNQKRRLEELCYQQTNGNIYSPRHIVSLLAKKNFEGKAYFYFENKNDYIILSTSGQLNAIDWEEGLFKPWGVSEFRDLNPQSIFRDLENMIREIRVLTSPERTTHSFNSYPQFIEWLEG